MIYSNGEWKKYEMTTTGSVVINFKDKDGNILQASETIFGKVGESYKINVKDIAGYNFLRSEGDLSGRYSDGVSSIILVYEKSDDVTSENGANPNDSETTEIDATVGVTENTTTVDTTNESDTTAMDLDKELNKESDSEFPWPVVAVPIGVIIAGGVIFVIIKNRQKKM